MRSTLFCLLISTSCLATDFHVDLGVYFGIPQTQVVGLRERHVPDQDLPVIMAAARNARVSPDVIVNMRLGGKSWTDIAVHFDLGPETFYLPVRTGPPYGNRTATGRSTLIGMKNLSKR